MSNEVLPQMCAGLAAAAKLPFDDRQQRGDAWRRVVEAGQGGIALAAVFAERFRAPDRHLFQGLDAVRGKSGRYHG